MKEAAQDAPPKATNSSPPPSAGVRLGAHLLTALLGLGMFGGAFASLTTEVPRVLTVALLVLGAAGLALPHYSFRGSRAAWAFAVSTTGAATPVLLFGSPKIASLFQSNLALANVPTAIALTAFVLMLSLSPEYERR